MSAHLLVFDSFARVVHDLLDVVERHELVELLEAVVAVLEAGDHLLLDLGELERVAHLVEVVELSVGALQRALVEFLLLEQQFGFAFHSQQQQQQKHVNHFDCAQIRLVDELAHESYTRLGRS